MFNQTHIAPSITDLDSEGGVKTKERILFLYLSVSLKRNLLKDIKIATLGNGVVLEKNLSCPVLMLL